MGRASPVLPAPDNLVAALRPRPFPSHLISTLAIAFSKGAVVAAAGLFFFFLALEVEAVGTNGREDEGARPGMEEEEEVEEAGASPGM